MSITVCKSEFLDYLHSVFERNGLSNLLSDDKAEKLFLLTERMLEENEKYNLTAIKEPKKIILNHYADCAALALYLPEGATLADIGCGAGFPTLPLAILRSDLKITAIDSTAKRVAYVAESARLLSLDNVTAITMRAEDGGKSPEYRERFDFATARAVAELRILAELCLPYVRCGGKMLAMKGKNAEAELVAAKSAIKALGGGNTVCREISLVGDEETLNHPLIVIDKQKHTAPAFPRPYTKISKKPL